MISEQTHEADQRWFSIQSRVREKRIVEAFRLFRQEGIEPILIKGWAAARFYPERSRRVFSDIDLCIAPEDFSRAENFLKTSEFNRLTVDLHKGFRHLDSLNWEDIYSGSITVEIEEGGGDGCGGGYKIRIPRPEDHLRILCVHWLTDGGAPKERLWDIFYAVENRPVDFDWKRCLETVSEKRRRWIICTLGAAKRYLGLSLSGLPFENEADDLPEWLPAALEKEWADGIRLKPLQTCLGDRKMFWRQVRKRIPPNPIQATVLMEGSFDRSPRFGYQFASFVRRMMPSAKRFYMVLKREQKT